MSSVAKLYGFFSSQVNESYEIWENCAHAPDSVTDAYQIFKNISHAPLFSSGSKISRFVIPLLELSCLRKVLSGIPFEILQYVKNGICFTGAFASWDKEASLEISLANGAKITKVGKYIPYFDNLAKRSFIVTCALRTIMIVKDRNFISLKTLKLAADIFFIIVDSAAKREEKEGNRETARQFQKDAANISLVSASIGLIKLGHQINNWQPADG